MSPEPSTVTEAIDLLRREGYDRDFTARSTALVCSGCTEHHRPTDLAIEHAYRFEGESDPDDEAVVYGLYSAACATRGVLVSGYGPSTDPDEIGLIRSLGDNRPKG